MKNTLLVQTLSAFTPAERQEIGLFLRNAYFSQVKHPKQIVRLFNLLSKKIDRQQLDDLTKKQLFAAFFQGEEATMGYFDNLMSELLGLLRRFILVRFSEDEMALDAAAAHFYLTRGMEERARQTLSRLETRLSTAPALHLYPSIMRCWNCLEVLVLESRHNQRRSDLSLPAAMEAFCVAFSGQLLHLSTLLYQQQRFVGDMEQHWNAFVEAFRVLMRQENFFHQPALQVLDRALDLITQASSAPGEEVAQFLSIFQQHESAFSDEMLKNLATYVRNFCSFHLEVEPAEMTRLLLSLYQEHLSRGWLYENDTLQPSYLLNMVTMGMRAGQSDWVWKMLQQHRGCIADDPGETIWQYSVANYHFYLGNLAEANKFVLTNKPKDIEIEKSMRILNVKIAYETAPQGPHLASQLQAFLMSLSRNKNRLAAEKHKPATHFIKTVRKLIQIGVMPVSTRRSTQIQGLKKVLRDPGYAVAERNWLQEKAALL